MAAFDVNARNLCETIGRLLCWRTSEPAGEGLPKGEGAMPLCFTCGVSTERLCSAAAGAVAGLPLVLPDSVLFSEDSFPAACQHRVGSAELHFIGMTGRDRLLLG